jgi:hypothetical protein
MFDAQNACAIVTQAYPEDPSGRLVARTPNFREVDVRWIDII